MILSLNIPPHFKCIAILPCEMSIVLKATIIENIDFGTNRKPICDFLLVINTNLHPILFTIWQIVARVTSCCDLDLWPLDLELLWSFGRHVFKLCVKFEQNRTIRCRVIDDLVHYRREISEGVAFTREDLRGAWTEVHQSWRGGHTSGISAHRVCFRVEISCCIFKRGPL